MWLLVTCCVDNFGSGFDPGLSPRVQYWSNYTCDLGLANSLEFLEVRIFQDFFQEFRDFFQGMATIATKKYMII